MQSNKVFVMEEKTGSAKAAYFGTPPDKGERLHIERVVYVVTDRTWIGHSFDDVECRVWVWLLSDLYNKGKLNG